MFSIFHETHITFHTPVEDRTYYGITCGVRVSGAYLQSYTSYGYEIL